MVERFLAKVDRTTECHIWLGAHDARGYGFFRVGKRGRRAHRVAWEMAHGPIPAGMHVCHKCDNPPCVNPAHLFLGTEADNAHDRDRKGRQVAPRGEEHGCARLNESDVREIRALRGSLTQVEIGRRYGIRQTTVSEIQRGNLWSHVK